MPHHKTGKEVLLRPTSRIERKARTGIAAVSILWRGGHNPDALQAIGTILRNDQSWARKFERIRAELLLSDANEFASERTLRELGLRKTICTCPPGKGHNAPQQTRRPHDQNDNGDYC